MNESRKTEIKQYLREIKKGLPDLNTKIAFSSLMKERIGEFLDAHPDATMEEIVGEFGTPEQILQGFEPEDYGEALKKKRRLLLIAEIAIAILVIALMVAVVALVDASSNNNFSVMNPDKIVKT